MSKDSSESMALLRTSYWYVSLYIKKHAKILIAATIGGILLFAGILPLLTQLPQIKPTRFVGVIGAYDFSTLPRFIQLQMSTGLTSVEEDGSVTPELAERWTVEDEGRTFRVILKRGLQWQDGKTLEPSDIKFNFQDTQVVTTQNEIVFKLKDPFAPFPVVISQPLFREVETSYLRFLKRKKIVGLGKYSVIKTTYQENRLSELVLESASDRIVYRFYLTEDRATVAFEHGKIDEILDLASVERFADWPNIETNHTVHTNQYLAVFFNQNEQMFEKNVRQSLSYALTKSDSSVRAKGPINPLSWAYLDSVKSYDIDIERATERMLDQVPTVPLNITLTTTPRFQADAETIKKEWEAFGKYAYQMCLAKREIQDKKSCEHVQITVTISITNFPDLNNYQALLVGQQIPSDPDQYSLWHSTQNTNFTHYKNPRIDALLENGRKTIDQNERKITYQEFQQFLLEDSPAVFLRYLETYMIKRK